MNKIDSKDKEFLAFIGKQESQFIQTKGFWRDDVSKFFAGDITQTGDYLPWEKTHEVVRLRPGEVSIWAGTNGHGKSMISGQVALWLAQKTRVLIASLEMKPSATLARMVRQAYGEASPDQEFIDRFFDWGDENIWIYDQLDTVEIDRIFGMLHYAAQVLEIKHVFIDSLMKMGIAPDDYSGQKEFVDRLCWVAKSENIHIHLIHHVRKGEKEAQRPDKWDIKGAGEITDLVDNVFIVWRNKPKEEIVKDGDLPEPGDPDSLLIVAKQRHGEWEGPIKLWFHPASQQFIPSDTVHHMRFRMEQI